MTQAPGDIERLIELMARLPGLGPRSARRAVLMMLKKRGAVMAPLAQVMAEVAASARDCVRCGRCERTCPQHLPIRELLQDVAAEFEAPAE